MIKHTPTPWTENEGARDSEFNFITGPKGAFICEIDISHPEQKSNAAYIVRAVNAHEALVVAMKNLLVANGNQKDFPNIWKEAANALNRAESNV